MSAADSADPDAVEAVAEALYGAALSTFTAERKRAAGELKARGDKAAAAAVARLPRPGLSAWVVNRLWREDRDDLDALLATGDRVRDGDRAGLDAQRAALGRLRTRAAAILASDGHAASPATIQRVVTTLQALSALGTWAPDRPGRLLADRDPPGFEVMLGAVLEAPPTRGAAPAAAPPALVSAAPAPTSPPPTAAAEDPAARRAAAAAEAARDRAAAERAARARVRAAERALLARAVEGMRQAAVQRAAELANARAEVEVAAAALARAHGRVETAATALADAEARAAAAAAALASHDDADRDHDARDEGAGRAAVPGPPDPGAGGH